MRFWARAVPVGLAASLLLACASEPIGGEPACDVARGKALFPQCAVCHSLDPTYGHGAGPNLAGIVGRPIGEVEGFKFSPALRRAEGTWTHARLEEFLADPFGSYPGARMAFAGIPNPEDREALVCYLAATLSTP